MLIRFRSGLDRDLWLLLGEMFSRRLVMGFLEVVRPIYFSLIGFSPIEIGILMGIGTIVSAFESLVFGSLSDRHGRKLFILLGSIFSVFRLVLYAVGRDFWVLILAQGLGAIGEGAGAGQPIVSGYIADKTDVKDRSHVFSVLAISSAVSGTIGSLMAILPAYFQIGLSVDEVSAYVLLFWLGAVANALAVACALPIKEPSKKREQEKDVPLQGLFWKEVGKFSIIRSTDGLGMGLVTQLLPLYFYLSFGADSEDLAPIYALARILAIPSYLLVPFFVRRLGNIKCIVISRLVTGLIITFFATASSFYLSAALFISYRLLFELAMPMRQAFSTELVKSHQTGTMLGISNSTRAIFQSLAPAIAGYLFEFASLSLPLFSGAFLLVVNGVQYHAFYRKTANRHEHQPT